MADYDIEAILTYYGWELPYLRPSGWTKVRCFEHEDRHASASVNVEAACVRCFTCGFSGDAIKVIRTKEGCGYADAVRLAESISGGKDGTVRDKPASGRRLPSQQRDKSGSRRDVSSWRLRRAYAG